MIMWLKIYVLLNQLLLVIALVNYKQEMVIVSHVQNKIVHIIMFLVLYSLSVILIWKGIIEVESPY